MDSKTPLFPKLSTENAHDWIISMRAFLLSQNLWEVITLPVRVYRTEDAWLNDFGPNDVPVVSEESDGETDSLDARRRRDKAVGIMIGHVTDDMRDRYAEFIDPSVFLLAVHNQSKAVDRLKGRQLSQELAGIKLKPKESINAYFRRGKDLAARLARIGESHSEPMVVSYLLYGLGIEYKQEQGKWLDPDREFSTLAYKEVLRSVEWQENLLKMYPTPPPPKPTANAMHAQGGRTGQGGRGGRGGRGQLGRGGRSGGRGTYIDRGDRGDSSGPSRPNCVMCGGQHDLQSCWKLRQVIQDNHRVTPAPPRAPAPSIRQQNLQRTASALVASLGLGEMSKEDREAVAAAILDQ